MKAATDQRPYHQHKWLIGYMLLNELEWVTPIDCLFITSILAYYDTDTE